MEQKITLSQAISKRKSVREYDMTPLNNDELNQILDYTKGIEPLYDGMKTELRLIGPNDIRALRSWRSPHYLAIYADGSDEAMVNVGYIYEQLTVYLTSLGLGTCWANSVIPKDNEKPDGMKWAATICFGRAKNGQPWREDLTEAKRNALNTISDQSDKKLEAVRIAPSTMNSQPWYFVHIGDKLRVYCVVQSLMKKWMSGMNRIDIGIALAHLKINNFSFAFEVEKEQTELKGYSYIGTVTL